MKTCTKCGAVKPLSDFYASAKAKDGKRWQCKNCDNAASIRWQKDNPESAKKYSGAWKIKNPDKAKAADLRWTAEHPERRREISRNWARKNPRKVADNSKRWLERNPDRRRENARAHRVGNRDKYIQYDHNRRARELGNGGIFTAAEWESLKAQYDFRCLGCGRREPEVKLSPDHVVPLARGGRNDIGNIQPLCCRTVGNCQSRKGMKIIDYRTKALCG